MDKKSHDLFSSVVVYMPGVGGVRPVGTRRGRSRSQGGGRETAIGTVAGASLKYI